MRKLKAFKTCPVAGCSKELLYTIDSIGYPSEAVCQGGHQFTVMVHGALVPRQNGRLSWSVLYVTGDAFTSLIDFQAVFHNTCNRIDDPRQFFGGIRELVRRLAEETDASYVERGVEPTGNPMRVVDDKLAAKGYGIGHGGC